jgi:ubiquitin carboxyl-terminal hydrolase 7
VRSFRFEIIPPILFSQLKRFKYDSENLIKINSQVQFTERLDLSSYYKRTRAEESVHVLYSVLVHEGNIHSGHYYVFIRDFIKRRWLKFNDTKVTIVREQEVFDKNFGGSGENIRITTEGEIKMENEQKKRTAYILIYVQESRISEFFSEASPEDVSLIN